MKTEPRLPLNESKSLDVETRAIAEAISIQERRTAQYNALCDERDQLREAVTKLQHELDLKDHELAALSNENKLLLRQIASFQTHVSTFYTHLRDMSESIAHTYHTPASHEPDMKQLETAISSVKAEATKAALSAALDDKPPPSFLRKTNSNASESQ